MFFVVPLLDAIKTVWPVHVDQVRWRFGAMGTLSNFILTPLLAILIAMALALTCKHRRLRRILVWTCSLSATALAMLLLLFVLDFLQIRTTVLPQFRHAMDITSLTVLGKLLLTVVTLVLFALIGTGRREVGWRAQDAPTPLIPVSSATRDSSQAVR